VIRRLNLLFIVPRFATINRGLESFVLELISRLDMGRFEITLLSASHQTFIPGVKFETAPLVTREKLAWIDRLPWLKRCMRPLGFGGATDIESFTLLWQFRHHWQQNAFDIVVPLGGSWSYRFARKALPKAKVVSIGQAGPVVQDLLRSDVFVALTPYDQQRALQMRPGIRSCLIPNGVDLQRFMPAAHGASLSDRVILCAAALVPDKRHDLLFDAVLRLPNHVRVKCVGTGPCLDILSQHPLALEGRVEFCQYSFAEMPNAYRGANVFSLAAIDEAFGIVFIEAMACGLPVVAHDGPRQRYVVNGGGVLCDTRNADEYAEAIRSMLDIAPCDKQRAHATKFDWSRIVTEYEKLFLKLFTESN